MSLGSFSLGSTTLAGPSTLQAGEGLVILVGGLQVGGSVKLKQNSLKIRDALSERDTASMVLLNRDNDWRPQLGERVDIFWDGDLSWAGTVEDFETELILSPQPCAVIRLSAVDFNQLADRRLVVESFQTAGQTAGSIVRYILENYLFPDGVVEGLIEDGPGVVRAAFNYAMVSDCFNELCERTGYVWYIDQHRRLFFHDRASLQAGFDLSDVNAPFSKFNVQESRSAYRNRQYLRGGDASTDERTERLVGDGESKVFHLIFPAAEVISVKVNSVTKTLGYRRNDEGKDFYWARDDKDVSQDDDAAAVAEGDFVDVTYRGLFPIVAVSELVAEIAQRASIEDNSGVYESMTEDQLVDDLDLAVEKINGLLNRFGVLNPDVSYETDRFLMAAGFVQMLNLTDEQVAADVLITSCELQYLDAAGIWRTMVRGTTGRFKGSWVEFFRRLLSRAGGLIIRENEVVNRVMNYFESITITDQVALDVTLDDGSGDPYTPALVGGPETDPNLDFGVGVGVVGDGEA